MRLRILLLLAALSWAGESAGQVLVSGSVFDAGNGDALISATVQVAGQTLGTVTNRDGRFTLGVPRLPVTLMIRHIGYRSGRVVLDGRVEGPVRVELEPDPVQMGELVVSGEDPAVGIMRSVLARKQAWRDTVTTGYAEVYSRFLLYREFELVEVEETIGASWWDAARGVREITRARRTRPSRNSRFLYAAPLPVPNLYDDEVVLDGTRFLGPLHPTALRFYNFRLTSQRSQDGRLVHDIAFSPANLSLAGFIGTLAVEDSTFDVLSMSARPVVDRAGPPPVLEKTVRLEQRFVRRGGGMMPVYFEANGWVRFGRAGVSYPRARYQQFSGISLHATQVPLPDSLFNTGRLMRDDPGVEAGAWLFDWNPGMIPFSEEEVRDISEMRTDRGFAHNFRPLGLLAQYAAVPVAAPRKLDVQIGVPKAQLLKPWVWYNRVDGWHVGVRPVVPLSQSITLRPGIAYAEAPDKVRWTTSARWDAGSGMDVEVGAERFSGISGIGTPRDRFLMGMAGYAGYDDYFDYYDRARRWGTVGLTRGSSRVEATVSHERHRSVEKRDEYEGWLRENIQRGNPAIDPGQLASAALRLTTGDAQMPSAGLTGHLDLHLEAASEGLAGSDFGFARWQGAAAVRIPTFMRRRSLPASLRLDVVAGGGSSGVPVQRRGMLDVATGPVASAVAFRSRRDGRLTARRWLAVFWEHDFGPSIAERLGLGETNLGFVIFGAHGTAWHGETTRRDEVGVAWSKPFNLPFRINLASRLGEFEPLVTVEYYGLAKRLFRR
ncbi:MAG: hypothetical protein ACI80V_001023 [Rhodothermales bacterium]|jgi:hypothetical protein